MPPLRLGSVGRNRAVSQFRLPAKHRIWPLAYESAKYIHLVDAALLPDNGQHRADAFAEAASEIICQVRTFFLWTVMLALRTLAYVGEQRGCAFGLFFLGGGLIFLV